MSIIIGMAIVAITIGSCLFLIVARAMQSLSESED